MRYPGFNTLNPATPATPLLSLASTGGSIAAGVDLGIRLSFVDQYGLETEASPETFIQTPAVVLRPNAPIASDPVATPVPGGLPGGTYVYALTKRLNTGESMLSDVTAVDVPFNSNALQSYVVPLQFDPISFYGDGTDSLCLYRTTGFDTNFVLLASITATPGLQNNLTTYTDTGAIQDSSQQPPQTSEFGKQNLLTVDWTTLNIPTTAYRFRVYITQQSGVWGTQHLFQDYLLVNPTTPFPNNVQYFGTETLTTGYPFDYTQIPFSPPKLQLNTDAVGAPIYTMQANAAGWPTFNFVFPTGQANSTPLFGAAYVDATVGGNGQFKLCLSTPSGANNPGVFTTLAAVGSGYAHPLTEAGGHIASHIYAAPTGIGGPTQDLINNIIATPVTTQAPFYRKQVTSIYQVTATPADLQLSTSGVWTNIPDMDTISQWPTGISPDFAGQWFEIDFWTDAFVNIGAPVPTNIAAALLVNGTQLGNAIAVATIGSSTGTTSSIVHAPLRFTFATPLTRSNNRFQIQWFLGNSGYIISYGGNIVGFPPRRVFTIKELF